MHIAIVTAGGAGMFCGSCMHDNAWARALREAGIDVTLMPLYTPIRVDEENLTSTRVFYGGINVYLDQHVPGWRHLPRWLTRPIDAPWLLNAATRYGISNNARKLGEMTASMLRGAEGPQDKEGEELVRFLAHDLKPDVICFSNAMLCGEVRRLKESFAGPVVCTLQGDDVFLDALIEPYRSRVFELLRPLTDALDGFLTHSHYYADYMQRYLSIPSAKCHRIPLAIDCRGHVGRPRDRQHPPTIGYFARIAPEKGLRELVEAAVLLDRRRHDFRVVAAGYQVPHHVGYFQDVQRLAKPLGDRFQYLGSPATVAEKSAVYQQYDLLSVPAPYREPKGLYILEAWANGVPVVEPSHGHFPELIDEAPGGLCVPPNDPAALAEGLEQLLSDEPRRRQMASAAWEHVRRQHDLPAIAQASRAVFEKILSNHHAT